MGAQVTYPWRDGRPLNEVLSGARRWLEKSRIVEGGGGYPDAAIVAAERRLRRPLPAEVREFYRAARPVRIFSDDGSADGPEEFGFYQLEQPELAWAPLAGEGVLPAQDWAAAEGLAFGQTLYGDPIFWVKGHRTQPDGCIAIGDHELALGDLALAVLSRSLAEFLARTASLRGLDGGDPLDGLSDDEIMTSEDDDLICVMNDESERYKLFGLEYAELNPTSRHRRT